MDDHIVDKRALRVEQRRILRLADPEPRGVVHGNMLDGGERIRAMKANVSHVANVENAHAGAHRQVLGNDARVFHGHIPTVKIDHLRAEAAMYGVECGLAYGGGGLARGQTGLNERQGLGCRSKLMSLTCALFPLQPAWPRVPLVEYAHPLRPEKQGASVRIGTTSSTKTGDFKRVNHGDI